MSLGTPIRAQAEIIALPYIQEHKKQLLQARKDFQLVWQHLLEPGREHVGPAGERIVATDRELIYLDPQGVITRRAPNGDYVLPLPSLREQKAAVRREELRRRIATNSDDAIVETYLKHANVTGYSEREARAVWSLCKQLTGNKPLREATRDDGRKIVQFFEKEGLKSATIQKKIGWLNAAVNLAIQETKLQFNPFSSIVPKRADKEKRLPLGEADIKQAKRNLDRLGASDQLLFRLLAASGMRLSEAFEIDGEMKERGCRYIIVGRKTPQSHRRIPLPAAVLPLLPRQIKEPLFHGGARAASKRLNRFLDHVGITDSRKVIHSLRHRAQDRLRAAGCPVDYRWALLGHEEKTVAEGYGLGFPVPALKRWIDKIGF
jgi:integrase